MGQGIQAAPHCNILRQQAVGLGYMKLRVRQALTLHRSAVSILGIGSSDESRREGWLRKDLYLVQVRPLPDCQRGLEFASFQVPPVPGDWCRLLPV